MSSPKTVAVVVELGRFNQIWYLETLLDPPRLLFYYSL